MVVDIAPGVALGAGVPRPLRANVVRNALGNISTLYDVAPDGRRFIVARTIDVVEPPPSQIVLVQNWLQEVKRLAPE